MEAWYRAGLIDIKAESGKRLGAKIKINWDIIKSEDIDWVEKLPRNAKITYCANTEGTTESTNCTPTLEIEKNRIDIEKDIEIDTDTEIDTEPTAEETSTLTGRTETLAENTSNTFGDYLQGFIDSYSYINYSYSPDAFCSTYYQELTELQSQVREGVGISLNIKDLSVHLHYYKTTGKVLV